MANKYTVNIDGSFQDSNNWSLDPSTYISTTVPTIGDDAIIIYNSNINGNIACDNIRGPGATSLTLTQNVTISANIIGVNIDSYEFEGYIYIRNLTLYGNISGGKINATYVTTYGDVIAINDRSAITSPYDFGTVTINNGNIINAPNGRAAITTRNFTYNPSANSYIKYATDGNGGYTFHFSPSSDVINQLSVPPVSAVRAGLQYANNTLTGTCIIPPASAVNFGAFVDNTTGTAALTSNSLFDVSVASLTASDSLGARLRDSATVESVGRIIASFSN